MARSSRLDTRSERARRRARRAWLARSEPTGLRRTSGGTKAGKFELYKDAAGKFRFRLKAGNGEIVPVGEAYESKATALNGIDSVKRNAADAALDDQTA
jgi:uncharacterized protein YegP (UPF0339 family)